MVQDKLEPGIHTYPVGTVPSSEISTGDVEALKNMPGVETNLREEPGKKPEIDVTVNTIVLPQEGKK